ncbi:MAG: flippase-like domain-containing protein [Paludibacteraceae bacterium]|nr:flippase-like domain-containing protein [Paludibacteraceae bacterium]
MTKRQVYHIIEWSVAIAACGYLIWRLATYEDYASLTASLRAMGWKEWGALVLCVALMPVNMAIEAWRWYSLMNEGVSELGNEGMKELKNERVKELKNERLTFREAQRQVYYSKLAGLITPWRLGEYPARGVLMESQESRVKSQESIWPQVLSMGAVGSATMTFAIVLAGVGAIALGALSLEIGNWKLENEYIYLVGAVMVLLVVGLALAPRLLKRWATVSHGLILKSVGQSLVRLVCWCVQLALVLWALGAFSFQPSAISSLFIYYLLVTITPNVPIAEVGVRGAWAIVVFGTANAALAGVILWAINTLLPCLIWPFIVNKKTKKMYNY